MADAPQPRPRVVVVGGGFGGLYCAKALARAPVHVTLIDRRNFHLFQPLLYQVATGGLSPANIAAPLRSILKYQSNTHVLLGEVSGFDAAGKQVLTTDGGRVPYDSLVLATGSTHHYFGKDKEWEPLAPGLKTIEDATEIRARVLSAFERAEREPDPAARKKLLTFVVVGGGPTGVEMAGTIAELARYTLRRDFRTIDPAQAHVVLVEGQPKVLPVFHPKLSDYAGKALAGLGVELVLDAHVTAVTADHVELKGDQGGGPRRIDCSTIVWAAGVKASPLGKLLAAALGGVTTDKGGRVPVGPDCSVAGHPDVFVIGDLASQAGQDGKPLPGLSPVAMQQGRYVADVIARRASGETPPRPFKYLDKGTMATIGRARAVADVNFLRFTGFVAWLAWLFIHVLYLAQFSNRVLVMTQWFWNFVTRNRSARLITGAEALPGARGHAFETPGPHRLADDKRLQKV
jgi:NADH dehydrogenase